MESENLEITPGVVFPSWCSALCSPRAVCPEPRGSQLWPRPPHSPGQASVFTHFPLSRLPWWVDAAPQTVSNNTGQPHRGLLPALQRMISNRRGAPLRVWSPEAARTRIVKSWDSPRNPGCTSAYQCTVFAFICIQVQVCFEDLVSAPACIWAVGRWRLGKLFFLLGCSQPSWGNKIRETLFRSAHSSVRQMQPVGVLVLGVGALSGQEGFGQ